ncbi:hypothetical protein P3T37_002973 [Kitasatospora sp. MAA4]|uniref:hypothetical protein n=1 Tax=Kitasatospora sp. MAA4 TaxID=3035093 RepID=UPI0024756361|nr:hypothetical protein [Kitasatospora sp. MAA4]MDH6133577.1 hypothetical protein [Kitasatospora sp. MAA4]
MSTNRSRRIDRDLAEQLLSGAADGRQGGPGALYDLLAAAASPGTARELAGEEAAVAAFREAAQLMPAQSTASAPQSTASKFRRRSMAGCAPARFLSTKIAAAALTATALGGVAVAAGTGNLPAALGGSTGGSTGAHTVPGAPLATTSASGHPEGLVRGSQRPDNGLAALCRAWSGAGGGTTPATPEARFAPLVRAAGGADRVQAFCAKLSAAAGVTPAPGVPGSASPDGDASHGPDADRTKDSRTADPEHHGPGSDAGTTQAPGTAAPSAARPDPNGPGSPGPTREKPDPGHRPQSPSAATDDGRPTR